jgi:DNA topoisomerase-1
VSKIKIKTNMTKTKTDKEKFDEAKALHKYIEKIRAKYKSDWEADDDKTKQHSVVLYLIDTLGLRPGSRRNGKTFGCCTLLVKHISLTRAKTKMCLTFLGKRLVPYKRSISVPDKVFTNLEQFKQGKLEEDEIFDKINYSSFNKYLKEIARTDAVYVTSKVIRTYRGCVEFEEKLEEYSKKDGDKKEQYNNALRDVTKFLNHKKKNGTKDNLITAKRWYLDPRIIVAWCKRFQVDLGDDYNETFDWAINTSDYKFAE